MPTPLLRLGGLIALTLLILPGCNHLALTAPPTSLPALAASPTASSPPPTFSPVLAGTPVPMPNEPITPDNIDRIQQLALWGKGRIEQLAYSPDGKILAVGTTAGVWLYDAETLAELRFINTGNFVLSLAFSLDSHQLITDVGASTLMTWDVATGEKLDSVRVRDGFVSSGAGSNPQSVFSDGAKLLVATLDDWTVGLWEVAGGKHPRTINKTFEMGRDDIRSLAISPDGTLLATGGYSEIKVWDAQTEIQLYTLPGLGRAIYSLAFSPGDEETRLLAVEGNEGQVRLWDARSGTLMHTIQTPSSSYVGAFAFSPDGKLLAVTTTAPSSEPDASDTPIVQIWQVTDGTLLRTLKADMDGDSLIFSPDSQQLTSYIPKGVIRRWDSKTGNLMDTLSGFDPPSSPPIPATPLFAYLSDDEMFISNPFNNKIELWNLETGQAVKMLEGHQSLITNLVLSDDGSMLVSTELWDNTIKIWDPVTGQNPGVYKVYFDTGYGKELAISPNGQLIAIGDARARQRKVYDSTDLDNQKYQLTKKQYRRSDPVFSPDGQKIAWFPESGTVDVTMTVSKAATGELLHTCEPTGDYALTFAPDSRILAVGTREGKIQFCDSATGKLVNTLNSETGNEVVSLAYSPNGRVLAVGMKRPELDFVGPPASTIELWDVEKGVLLQTLEGYQANIHHLEFSPDGALLATASLDGTMRLWGIPPK